MWDERLCDRGGRMRAVFNHAPGDCRAKNGFAVGNGSCCPQQLVGTGVFEQVAAGTGAHRCEHQVVVLMHGQHQHMETRKAVEYATRRVNTVRSGHAHVHDDDVWLRGFCLGDGLLARRSFTDHLDIWHSVEDEPHSVPKEPVIVSQHDANRRRHSGAFTICFSVSSTSGKRASTRVPTPAAESIVQLPPSSAARSRIDTSPMPARTELGRPRPSSTTSRFSAASSHSLTEQVWASACDATFASAA